jgi:ATP-dependent DNA helicase DinG
VTDSTKPTSSSASSSETQVELSRLSLYQFFGPGGVLSQRHPAYEFRKGQLAMATAVEEAIDEKRHLIVEAGTGTGKTLAYLLPIIKSGKRVIVSTGTKNLQEQLFFKDVPFLERALFGELTEGEPRLKVCYMKGRQNYLCRKKLYDLTDQPILNGLDEINEFRTLLDWDKETSTGDRAEITTLPETSPLWGKLNASAEHCVGSKCAEFGRRERHYHRQSPPLLCRSLGQTRGGKGSRCRSPSRRCLRHL